ncbi:MAG: glycosyl transferase family 36 [Cyanobacteria bacterium P01_D01_bin.123]
MPQSVFSVILAAGNGVEAPTFSLTTMHQRQYGYFTADYREFVITEPRTPRPWFNYMWNSCYTGLISHTGGGFSCLESPRDNRITRMRYNSLPWDRPGRYVLVKDVESVADRYWSLSWAPTIQLNYDRYECHHGQGYTRIVTELNGIRGEITYFVPTDVDAELWLVSLKNVTERSRSLELYTFTELLMGNALNDLINQPNDKHFPDVHFDRQRQALVATRRYWVLNKKVSVAQPNLAWGNWVLFGQSLPVTGFDGSLDRFIGRWRSETNPIAVETGEMGNSEITAGDPVVALQSRLHLAPGEKEEVAIALAVVPRSETELDDPFEAIAWSELVDVDRARQRLRQVQQKWDGYLSTFHVETPDEAFNASLNVWNPYQAAVTFDMARNAGFYHGGLLFGTGMRDRFQDILGVVMVEPQRVRDRLLDALRYQFQDGSTLHNFFKLTGWGERTNHSDTPLWVPFGIVEYLKETGDRSILDEMVPFYDEGEATVYRHVVKALEWAVANLSDRGLPKIQNGDWNDTLDHVGPHGQGETVWGAFFLGYVLKQSLSLFEFIKDEENLARFRRAYEALRKATNDYCWDGNWYVRAFRDNGKPIGCAAHKQGQIFLNAQSWAVLSGLAPQERAAAAIAACRDHLATPYGMQICWPAYTKVENDVGLISRCVPGKKENGAIFNHASSWFVLAALTHGEVDFAYDIYHRMLPLRADLDSDRREVEPYVFPEYVTSPEHPTEGQGSHTWLTGTAVWMLRIGLDAILGFKTTLTHLEIDPHIPSYWAGFRARRKYRGKSISLTVRNPDGCNLGVTSMIVNGRTQAHNRIDVSQWDENTLNVDVVLGARAQ